MRTFGRVYTNGVPGPWEVVNTDPNGFNDFVYLTTLCQVLKLQLGESPFDGNYGIPAVGSVLSQTAPDFNIAFTQQQFAKYFASLVIAKQNTGPPTYKISVVTTQGAFFPITVSAPQ